MEQIKYDVFISYSRKDYVDEQKNVIPGNEVSKIKEALTKAGISYWFDEDGVYSGDEFAKVIVKNIKASCVFVFLSTKNSNQSEWTASEISTAHMMKKKIIPVRIDDSIYHDDVILYISRLSHVDYNDNPVKGRKELIRSINGYLEEEKAIAARKAAEEKQKLEQLERQRREEEEAKKRQAAIEKMEVEISAQESRLTELKRVVLQKEQELKIAQLDLEACESKIQKLQIKLENLRLPHIERKEKTEDERNKKDTPTLEWTEEKERGKSNQKQTKELKYDWEFSEILVKCKKVSSVFERDSIEKSIDIFKFQEILYNEYGILLDLEEITSFKTIGNLKNCILKRVKEDRFWKGDTK